MFEIVAQILGVVTDYVGQATGRHGWKALLLSLLVIAIGCSYLLASKG